MEGGAKITMDTSTGEIKQFASQSELQKAIASGNWEALDKAPNPNCKRCHGRGHLGYNVTYKKYVPCKCTKIRKKRVKPMR